MSDERQYWADKLKEVVLAHPEESDVQLWERLHRVWESYGTVQWMPVGRDEFLAWRAEAS